MAGGNGNRSAGGQVPAKDQPFRSRRKISRMPEWISASEYLSEAFYLAARAHDSVERGVLREPEPSREAAEARMDTSVASLADHYRDSVQMIADIRPGSAFLSALRLELDRLDSVAA